MISHQNVYGDSNKIEWLYSNLYNRFPSRLSIDSLNVYLQPLKLLDNLGYKYEILEIKLKDFYLSRRSTDNRNEWYTNELDLNIYELYNYKPALSHPEYSGMTKDAALEKYESIITACFVIHLLEHEFILNIGSSSMQIYYNPNKDAGINELVNSFRDYIYYEPIKEYKSTPSIRVVNKDEDNHFYNSSMDLPYNPITDSMLENSYHITTGLIEQEFINGKDFRDDIVSRLGQSRYVNGSYVYPSKGLYILHGSPGTGKSKFLSQLLLDLQTNLSGRNIYYFPPQCVQLLGCPEFMPWLYNNPGCIIIAEDAETVLQRQDIRTSATSNILNMTDGLLGDALQITLIATFNCAVDELDPALLRKGRLRTVAEFMPLERHKAEVALQTILKDKYSKSVSISDIELAPKDGNSEYTLAEIYSYINLEPDYMLLSQTNEDEDDDDIPFPAFL